MYVAIRLFDFAASNESVDVVIEDSRGGIPDSSDALAQPDSVTPTVTLVESSKQDVASDNVHVMASESDTVDGYLTDIENFQPANNNTKQFGEGAPPTVLSDTEVTLWYSVPSVKSLFENYGSMISLSEEHFIEFDESTLEILEVGQRFTLPKLGESRQQVIVKQQEDWENGATNWVLVDNQGKPAGSLTKTQDGVDGIFEMPNGTYHLLTRNGIGWIADETTLINASEQAFSRLDKN